MGLTAGIVGLPNVGKSTLFNAITKSKAVVANYPFTTIEPNVGYVELHDARLYKLAEIIKPKKIIATSFSFTDIAGLVKGASHGEGLGNQFLSHIRETDAICQVVRCFEGPHHVGGNMDPLGDIEAINLELIIADLDIVEKRIPKLEKKALLKVDGDLDTEYRALQKIAACLQDGRFARESVLTPEELKAIHAYNFLTLKPMIYILNISDKDINKADYFINLVQGKFNSVPAIAISAQIEAELAELSDDARKMFLEDLGITRVGLDLLVEKTYDLLNLATFFTAGEKEVRAWKFRRGMKAQECAGLVHTDFARGFIRAEVIGYDEFMSCGNMQKSKEAGKIRSEGREYLFRDGDIALFRFNV